MTSQVDSTITAEVDGLIGRILLGTPGAVHVIDEPFATALLDAVERLGQDERVRAVIVSSRARVFCAGVRFELVPQLSRPEVARSFIEALNRAVAALAELPKPTVAAVGGAAFGGGHNLALACDVLIASESAVFCQSFGNIGLATDGGSLYLLPRRVGFHRAKELALTARPLQASEAYELGAVDEVVDDGDFTSRAEVVATSLAERSPLSIAAMKRGFVEAQGMSFRESLALELRLQMPQFASQDLQDAAAAFLEKRPVSFRGH